MDAYGGDVKRVSETDWLKHRLKTLAKTGFSGLKGEPMAWSPGISKKSFYWRFEDLAGRDQATHHWVQYEKRVARRLQSVDQARIAYLCKLLRRTGGTEKDVLRRARFIYAASLGDRLIADNACPAYGRADRSELAAALAL
ncbi:MAG: hypothetical protein AAGL49_13370 [Pseudomonadota bacterium]